MIEYIRGRLTSLQPTDAIIETQSGVAYIMSISLFTFSALEGAKEAKLLTHEVLRDDARQLYGFIDERERALFRQLIGVSGVGAATARMILSAIAPDRLEAVITSGDTRTLKSVKGVGARTAERIIVDLRDKIKADGSPLLSVADNAGEVFDEALAALLILGYQKAAAQKALDKIFKASPGIKVEQAIKQALSMM